VSNKILYFLEIRVPESTWFTRMLLYWDNIGTIIPLDFMNQPENLRDHTRSLVQSELVTPVIPGMFLYQVPKFDEAFAKYLESLTPTELDRRRQRFREGETTQIHVEKVGALEWVIKEYGLCKDGGEPYSYSPWYAVERDTAADFMAYLAASRGRLDELRYVPITDKKRYCEPLLRGIDRPIEHREDLTTLRLEILEDILPAPMKALSADEIWNFKNRHGQELSNFRRAVEREVVDAAAIPDPELRSRRLELFRQEVDEQVKHIEARLRENGFGELVFAKLCPVMAAIPGVSFIFGLASAVYNAFEKAPEAEPPSPLVYAAYAQVELPPPAV
jgi:hypothetical protein